MRNMSKLLYKALKAPYLKEVLNDINEVCNKLNIHFFGVGALARNVWYIQNDGHSRGTKDIDFGVYIANNEMYNLLLNEFVDNYNYTKVKTNAFCLISPQGAQIDLLPFGEIENEGKVLVEGKGLVSINLEGFKETFEHGIIEEIIEGDILKVCSIPSVVLLKLIAFDDRPEQRHNDPLDISSIIEHYPQIETELIWEEYNFLYEDDEKSHDEIGVEVLGYEISKIILHNTDLKDRLLSILDKAIKLDSSLAELMIIDAERDTRDMKIKQIKLLKNGILKGIQKYS